MSADDQDLGATPALVLRIGLTTNGVITFGSDRIELISHGLSVTHVDGFNHLGVDGNWYLGRPTFLPAPSVMDWADKGLVTRGVFLDIPAVRGTRWVDVEQPVTGSDLDGALDASGANLEPGDALLIYMGRDLYEDSIEVLGPATSSPKGRPGVGESGAAWIAERPVSAVLWDMQDALGPEERLPLSVHLLIWAQGLTLVDNCELGPLRSHLADRVEKTGLVMVSPLKIRGATSSVVNPLLMI